MRKFTLDLDHLQVESFDTTATYQGGGTVVGHHHDTQPPPAASQTDEVHTACGSCNDSCYFGNCNGGGTYEECTNGATACNFTCCSDPC